MTEKGRLLGDSEALKDFLDFPAKPLDNARLRNYI